MHDTHLNERLALALIENRPAAADSDPRLSAALAQVTGNPGKLVRARLVHAAVRVHAGDDAVATALACAVEYFHIASLLFDDLPCMDDSWKRRGLPCAHRLHGEAAAMLAALALINRAYALIGFALANQPAHVRLQATACLDASLGMAGLVGGQARDLNFGATDRSPATIARIAAAKTGSLFWLSVYFPALLADPDRVERRALKSLCIYWGLAFQAADDLQDVLGDDGQTGKTAGRDQALDRPNLALALGMPAARGRVMRLMNQAAHALAVLSERGHGRWDYLAIFHREFAAPMAAMTMTAAAA